MFSVEKGLFIRPLFLAFYLFLLLLFISPALLSTSLLFILEWSAISVVVLAGFVAYFVNPFRKRLNEERLNPLHVARTPPPLSIQSIVDIHMILSRGFFFFLESVMLLKGEPAGGREWAGEFFVQRFFWRS